MSLTDRRQGTVSAPERISLAREGGQQFLSAVHPYHVMARAPDMISSVLAGISGGHGENPAGHGTGRPRPAFPVETLPPSVRQHADGGRHFPAVHRVPVLRHASHSHTHILVGT